MELSHQFQLISKDTTGRDFTLLHRSVLPLFSRQTLLMVLSTEISLVTMPQFMDNNLVLQCHTNSNNTNGRSQSQSTRLLITDQDFHLMVFHSHMDHQYVPQHMVPHMVDSTNQDQKDQEIVSQSSHRLLKISQRRLSQKSLTRREDLVSISIPAHMITT